MGTCRNLTAEEVLGWQLQIAASAAKVRRVASCAVVGRSSAETNALIDGRAAKRRFVHVIRIEPHCTQSSRAEGRTTLRVWQGVDTVS